MGHENSVTEGPDWWGRWQNLYGQGPLAGEPLPLMQAFERDYYPNVGEAVAAARLRSFLHWLSGGSHKLPQGSVPQLQGPPVYRPSNQPPSLLDLLLGASGSQDTQRLSTGARHQAPAPTWTPPQIPQGQMFRHQISGPEVKMDPGQEFMNILQGILQGREQGPQGGFGGGRM